MHLGLSIEELADLLEGSLTCDTKIDNIVELKSLEQAKAQDISIIFDTNLISKESIQNSQAGCIIAATQIMPNRPFLLVESPLQALSQLIKYKKQEWITDKDYDDRWPNAYVSSFATIDNSVTIEPGVVIKSHSIIGPDTVIKAQSYIDHEVTIGENCIIGPHVTLHDQTIIRNNVQIDAQTTIGTDGYGYLPSKEGFKKIPHAGNVQIGNSVEIGASVVIDRALFDSTIIEDGCKIDNHVYIAHNVLVKAHTLILGHVVIGGSTKIGSWCKIGAQTTIKDHITIGNQVNVVGKSGIITDVKDQSTIAGSPATPLLQWKKQIVCLRKLPDFFRNQKKQNSETPL
ncbi:UDP-3-O-(3-hydroxymyristoyl)glucosamine N-acyltransferase [Candidatus Babeliales bacterium]|nr:UDP-3-O-(3-hydroxymyristoyl)glucosamine N-acyltransferase [Candidatus Babeliales bacterium]